MATLWFQHFTEEQVVAKIEKHATRPKTRKQDVTHEETDRKKPTGRQGETR